MRVLDLFCGGGGAAAGLHAAGFDEIVGIDTNINHRKHYPFTFIQADVFKLPINIKEFDFVWASPPCQFYSCCSNFHKKKHPRLIDPVRQLIASHPFTCIENVPMRGKWRDELRPDVILTGPSMGLPKIQRTRWFELSFFCLYPEPKRIPREQWRAGEAYTITKSLGASSHFYPRKANGKKGCLPILPTEHDDNAHDVMGIKHRMTAAEIGEAVPPVYAELIGKEAIRQIRERSQDIMFLFTKEMMYRIMEGRKTQTRRLHFNARARVGSEHWAQTTMHGSSRFARLKITKVWEWDGKTISDEDIKKEGFESQEAFWEVFNKLNRLHKGDPRRKHYAYEFEILYYRR